MVRDRRELVSITGENWIVCTMNGYGCIYVAGGHTPRRDHIDIDVRCSGREVWLS